MSGAQTQHYKYKAFISYNHADYKFARYLHTKLENFKFSFDKKNYRDKPLHPIFIDNNELKAGAKLSEAIQTALAQSEFLIVICSENSTKSNWVRAEISHMRALHKDANIIAIIPNKGGDESHLLDLLGAEIERLAADFRPGKNRSLQLSKIAATLLNRDLDELYQREARRRNKQMLGFGISLSVIATLMSGLAANAYLSEKEAVRQRQKSEEVIAFMVDEFRDDLETLDKLELLSDLGAKAQDYFDDRDLDLLSDESILLQSRTLRQLSDVDEKRGNIGVAKKRIESAYAASTLMIDRQPNRLEALTEHAENSEYWGYIEYQLGHLETAKDLFETATTTYASALKLIPDDQEMTWKASISEQNIGIMLLQMGRSNEARPYLQNALRAIEYQYENRDLNEDELYEYANTYTWYIRTLPDNTPISFLYDTRQKQLQLFEDMREHGARSILNQSEKLNVERAVVILLLQSGRDDEALALMQSIQNEFTELLEHDSENVGWRRHLMRSKLTLGLLHHKYERINERNKQIDETIKLGLKPNGEKWGLTSDIDRRMNRLKAYRFYDDGKLEEALEVLNLAEKDIVDRWKGEYRPRVRYNLASLKSFKAELLKKTGRTSEANAYQAEVLDLLKNKDSYSVAEQNLKHAAYSDLGRIKKAADMRSKLEARGVAIR